MDVRAAPATRTVHPFVYAVLYLPFGAVGGYLGGVLAYQLKGSGVSTAEIAALFGLGILPNVLKVLWAPLVDTLFNPKGWFAIGALLLGLGVAVMGVIPPTRASLIYLGPLFFLLNFAATFVAIAADALMAHATSPEEKGRAGGWSQAGNVGGGPAIGGGLGLWLAIHASPLIGSVVVGAVIVACALPLIWLPRPSQDHRHPNYLKSLLGVGLDAWRVARSRAGVLALLILLLPLGTGIAASFFPAISREWRATADLVSLMSTLGGFTAIFGAVIGGYVCDWMDRKAAYVLFSVIQAGICVGMALAPRTPELFAIFNLAYAATTGMAYAAYAAVTLETIGGGAAATKFNLMASVANAPLYYVNAIEGPVQTRFGSAAMLFAEAGLAVAAAALYGAVMLALGRRREAVEPA
jgi:MFS family permease